MENSTLPKLGKKCLYALKKYPHADIGIRELNGYLHFPPLDDLAETIGILKSKNLVEDKISPFHGLRLTELGKEYIRKHRLAYRLAPHVKAIIASVIGGLVVAIFAKWLGLN